MHIIKIKDEELLLVEVPEDSDNYQVFESELFDLSEYTPENRSRVFRTKTELFTDILNAHSIHYKSTKLICLKARK